MVNKIMPLFILIFIKSSRSLHYKFSTLPLNRDENWDVTLRVVAGGSWWQQFAEAPMRGGPRDLFVICLFVKGLCAIMVVQLFSVSYSTVSVFV